MNFHSLNVRKLANIGLLEILFAMYPMLTVYKYEGFPFSLFILLVMDIIVYAKSGYRKSSHYNKIINLLFGFVILHEFLLIFIANVGGEFISKLIEYCIIFYSIKTIYPNLDFHKLHNSLNIVAVVCMLGLVYHFVLIQLGQTVYPLTIPFLPDMAKDSKMYVAILRPTSFFYEPQHYCSFMIIPFFLSLVNKQKIWAVAIVLSIFLSTSSYGIMVSFIMLTIFALFQKSSMLKKFEIVLGVVILGYFLATSTLFSSGIEKIENTDIERTSRIYNGPTLISNMPKEDLILGIPYPTVSEYYFAGKLGSTFLIEKNKNVYLPSFYNIFAKFGIIGIILYLLSYFVHMFKRMELFILGSALMAGLFSNPDSLGSMYAFYIIFIYHYLHNNNESINYNNPVYK